jgi:hypothetical protein
MLPCPSRLLKLERSNARTTDICRSYADEEQRAKMIRPSKQPLMVRTFLKVYMELGSYFLFLQEQIKDIITTSSTFLRLPRSCAHESGMLTGTIVGTMNQYATCLFEAISRGPQGTPNCINKVPGSSRVPDRGALQCHWTAFATKPIGQRVPVQTRGILHGPEEQSRTRGG